MKKELIFEINGICQNIRLIGALSSTAIMWGVIAKTANKMPDCSPLLNLSLSLLQGPYDPCMGVVASSVEGVATLEVELASKVEGGLMLRL